MAQYSAKIHGSVEPYLITQFAEDPPSNAQIRDEAIYASVVSATTAGASQPQNVPDFDPAQFSGAFWTPDGQRNLDDGFEDLKRYLRQGNDFCKDIIELMKERAAIEDMYAKKLQGLYVKSLKLSENTFGSLKSAWTLVLGEFKDRAEWHLGMCDVIKRSVCDPLAAFKEQQKKEHKTIQVPVEKALKTLTDVQALVAKHVHAGSSMSIDGSTLTPLQCKRTAHSKSREAEAANAAVDEAKQNVSGKPVTEKDLARLGKNAAGSERLRDKADSAYRDSMDKASHSQEDWETAMINGCKSLQRCEEDRIRCLKRVLLDYGQHYVNLMAPMEKCFGAMMQGINAVSPADDIAAITKERGSGPYVSVQPLYDCLEESMQNPMDRNRRRTLLVDKLDIFRQDVSLREKMRLGLLKMWEGTLHCCASAHGAATRDTVRDGKGDPQALYAVTRQLVTLDYVSAASHANVYKLRCALADTVSNQRPTSSLSHMIDKKEDKGVCNSLLRMPPMYRVDLEQLKREAQQAAATDQAFGEPMAPATRRLTMAQARATRPTSNTSAAPAAPSPAAAAAARQPVEEPPEDPVATTLVCRCRVQYDYEPAEEDELRLRVGDVLDVYDNTDDTWWQGSLKGRMGVFPAAYVEVV